MSDWWVPSQNGELPQAPWLHPDVVAYLEKLLDKSMNVLEHGSGGSTMWLAERVKKVVALETKQEWFEQVQAVKPGNVRLILWKRGELPKLYPAQFDLLLIDGEPVEDRVRFLQMALELVRPGGYVVLDNANRPEYRMERIKLSTKVKVLKIFDRNVMGKTSYMVTEFYQLKGEPAPVVKASKKGKGKK